MEHVDLRTIVEQTAATFRQNRIGDQPTISLNLPSLIATIPWPDRKLGELVRRFFYETLLTNDPGAGVTVSLQRRSAFRDLGRFVGVTPSYWIHVRISGRGVNLSQRFIEEFFSDIGYPCKEWVGAADSQTRLGIFASVAIPEVKFVFCIDSSGSKRKYDLLLPVHDPMALPEWRPAGASKRLIETL